MKFNQRSLLVVLGCIVAFLVWLLYNAQVRLLEHKEQVSKLDLTNQKFEEKLTTDSLKIAEQEQVILTQKDAIEYGILEIDRLKKIKSQVKTVTVTKIDSVLIPFKETLEVHDTIYPVGVIEVPKRFSLSDEYYSFNGIVFIDGLLMDSLSVFNSMKVTIGSKPNGFLKKKKPIIEIENTNPYIQTMSMNNVIIEEDKKFYSRKGFWFGIGVLGGIIITK